MPRKPPVRNRRNRGPLATKDLPDHGNARVTWNGAPPQQRTKGRWSGSVSFDGKKHHVGTFDTPRQWGVARDKLIDQLKKERAERANPSSELANVTVAEFVGAPGEGWPWSFDKNGRRRAPSTFEHHEQCIRPFVARYGDRLLKGGIARMEAIGWVTQATENQVTSAIAMFNDACFVDESVVNPLRDLSRRRTRGRMDLKHVLTTDEVDELKRLSLALHPDGYGPVLEAMVETEATTAPRPGEMWAFEWDLIDVHSAEVKIKWAVKKGGRLGLPKTGERDVVVAPSAMELIQALPRLNPRFVFATKNGRLMSPSNWTTYWHPLRDAFTAGLPSTHWLPRRIAECAEARATEPDPVRRARMDDGRLDFYELRHRAITYMATPKPDGLGMAPPDIAYQVGHSDGGILIERVYIHRASEGHRARIRRAMGYSDNDKAA